MRCAECVRLGHLCQHCSGEAPGPVVQDRTQTPGYRFGYYVLGPLLTFAAVIVGGALLWKWLFG